MKFLALSSLSALLLTLTNADSGPCFKSGITWTDASAGGGAASSDILSMCQNNLGGTYGGDAVFTWCLPTTGSDGAANHIDFKITNLRSTAAYMDPNGCHDYIEGLFQQCPRGADFAYTGIEWEFRFDPNTGDCGNGSGDVSN